MKTLYLTRHAKSSWKDQSLDDFDRPLNKRGKRDAPFMGQLLKKKNILPDVLISSPAVRAYTTARTIASEIGYPPENILADKNIYEASSSELLDIINSIEDENQSAMMFGHNPGFTTLCHYLTGKDILNIPTCGIVKIEFEKNKWSEIEIGTGNLIWFEYPKKYF
ncbi:MAG: histidine phosphatase family protein [Ignavibacteria bacterium]|jgi:phosphohistidine phosphatase